MSVDYMHCVLLGVCRMTLGLWFIVGNRYKRVNIHCLSHLPQVVRNLGPLWAHSCFPFETAIGDLQKLFHGSQGVENRYEL